MPNILSYLLASAYAGFTPWLGAASATCTVNGQLAQCPSWPGTFIGAIWWISCIAILVFYVVSMWKVFTKAGKPGWAAIIPFYNTYTMIKIAGKPGWWLILFFIPIVNAVFSIIVIYNLAKNFGKGGGFTVGLIFLPFIFYPILAFGKATYLPTSQQPPAPTTAPPQVPPIVPQQPITYS